MRCTMVPWEVRVNKGLVADVIMLYYKFHTP